MEKNELKLSALNDMWVRQDTVGKRVKALRRANTKLTQERLAKELDVSMSRIKRLEIDSNKYPDMELVHAIAELFHVDPVKIQYGNEIQVIRNWNDFLGASALTKGEEMDPLLQLLKKMNEYDIYALVQNLIEGGKITHNDVVNFYADYLKERYSEQTASD